MASGLAIFMLASGAASAAYATPVSKPSIDDPVSTLSATAPEILMGDAPSVETNLRSTASMTQSMGQEENRVATPEVNAKVSPDASSLPQTVSVALDGTSQASSRSDSTILAKGKDPNVARYVVESTAGIRIVTAYGSPQQAYESRTTFSFKAGEHPVPGANGSFYIEDSKGDIHGAIMAPWARDSSGTSLPTTYRWDRNTLIQKVDVPASASFPVVADPAWNYTWTAKIYAGSTRDIHGRMHTCFNCYFPVEGAPAAFPRPGQLLPLVVRLAPGFPANNFTCIFGAENFIPGEYGPAGNAIDGDFAFYFNSGPGHIDGPGSMISFDFYGDKNAPGDPKASLLKMKFVVFANITNESPGGVPQPAYLIGAKNTWAKLLSNYTSAVTGVPGGEGQFWSWVN